jgi:hypothetical protein
MSTTGLARLGFAGFVSVAQLRETDCHAVPEISGVYVVVATDREAKFLETSVGGHFKGREPSVPTRVLDEKWVNGAEVLYLGRSVDLRRRVGALVKFGSGRPVGHWGGRYLWQLDDSESLTVAWMDTTEPEAKESHLLRLFREEFGGQLPFANLRQ